MLPDDVRARVEAHLGSAILAASAVGGGCISHATRIRTVRGEWLVKWGRGEVGRTFTAEAAGLEVLHRAASPLIIPKPVLWDAATDDQAGFILMAWIESGGRGAEFWEAFGRGLSDLHRFKSDRFGFQIDNYIGRLPQRNDWEDSWPEFFRSRRIEPQVALAVDRGRWDSSWSEPLDRLYGRLSDLLPPDPEPSILHGDLWSGNFMVDSKGRPVLVDPASYFGHREADLAMTELFGGFDQRFYAAYKEAWPLDSGYEERRDLYNLYHLINHLNHFGGGYAGSVESILLRF